jgi:hypothetical protein
MILCGSPVGGDDLQVVHAAAKCQIRRVIRGHAWQDRAIVAEFDAAVSVVSSKSVSAELNLIRA